MGSDRCARGQSGGQQGGPPAGRQVGGHIWLPVRAVLWQSPKSVHSAPAAAAPPAGAGKEWRPRCLPACRRLPAPSAELPCLQQRQHQRQRLGAVRSSGGGWEQCAKWCPTIRCNMCAHHQAQGRRHACRQAGSRGRGAQQQRPCLCTAAANEQVRSQGGTAHCSLASTRSRPLTVADR